MANQIYVNSGTGNITVTTSRAVIGTVANVASANFANFAGEVVDASQPNITSLGNLTGLNVTGTTTTLDLVVTGNFAVGNLVANSANYANFAGTANVANAVAGANVTGTVANATFATTSGTANSATVANSANSVALANVSGAGNIASINLTGSTSNVLFGNGVFGPVTATLSGDGGNISNIQGANVSGAVGLATFATTANAVAGANVTGTVANATYATSAGSANTANSATIANSANSVTLANVSGAGNIASINLTGSTSNVLFGNGVFASIPSVPLSGDGGNISNIQGANVSGAVGLATNATTANAVAGANVSGTVANATFATSAGSANTANSATVAASANAVAGANVSGEVANANYASFANIANSANSVAVANVSGIGNIATVNLDGNASNVLFGNGTFGPEGSTGNANYANFAGTAFSVSGSNVSGEVANANFASYSNVANSANAVAGANVSGTVANATFALDAGNANVANTANSVAVANVSGIGNIATVNLDGNVSNLLTGNGTFVAIPTSVANANYANFAGDVVNSSQSNITSVGNLTSLQVGNGTDDTLRFVPAGSNLTLSTGNVLVAQNRIATTTAPRDAVVVSSGTNYTQQYFAPDGSNVATFGSTIYSVDGTVGSGNAAVEGSFTQRVFSGGSNLTTGNIGLSTDYVYGGGGLLLNQKTPATGLVAGTGLLQTISYGEPTDLAASVGLRFQRRRGNNNTRLSLQPNDYVGNIEWRPGRGGSNYGTTAKFGAKVDGGYTANSNPLPIGMEMGVVNSSGTQLTHSFYANGDVNFTNTVNATNFTGNGAGLTNLPGGSSITNGNSSVSFTGAGGDLLINIDNAQYATFFNNRKLQLDGIEADSGNASQLVLNNGGIQLIQEDLGGGFASFDFKSYFSTGFIAPYTFYRARGNTASPNNVQSGDAIKTESYIVYGDSGNTFLNVGTYSATVTANDNAGNVQSRIEIATARNDNGSEVKLNADVVVLEGNSAIDLNANTNMGSGSLFKLASFTASALNAITGSIGQMAAVSDSAGGGNPNGMIAFWDTTNARWSYVHNNSAV